MGSYYSMLVQCPFYKKDDSSVIYCEGIEDNSAIHLAFGAGKRRIAYIRQFCCANWWDCRIARMLEEEYEEEGK